MTIELTIVSADGLAHRVLLRAPRTVSLNVPAHARASAFLSGLKPGRYVLDVDGIGRAALIVGAQPGP